MTKNHQNDIKIRQLGWISFGNLAGFHSATWLDFIRQLSRIQSPLFSHIAMASRNLGTTAWSFTGPMTEKMQSPTRMAANSDASTSLPSLNRKIEKISGYGSLASVKCHHSSTTGLNPCVTMTERSSMRFRESRRVLYCALFLVLSVSACYFLIPLIFSILTTSGTALPCSKASHGKIISFFAK